MKKIFLLIQFAALTAGVNAFAIAGGPFDNGDYSILNERNGFYQETFTFQNGNGYALWTPDSLIGTSTQGATVTPNVGTGSLFTPATTTALSSHNANRSVFYYKGVTYFGSALGSIDMEARSVQGFYNASSEFQSVSTTTQATSSSFFFGQANTTTNNSSNVVSSGRSYVINASFTGEITETSPQLRYSGVGELTVISPNGNEAIAGLAYGGFSGLISSINQSVAQSGTGGIFNNTNYTSAQAAIASALTNLTPYLTGTGPTNSYSGSEKRTLNVTGYRRFF